MIMMQAMRTATITIMIMMQAMRTATIINRYDDDAGYENSNNDN